MCLILPPVLSQPAAIFGTRTPSSMYVLCTPCLAAQRHQRHPLGIWVLDAKPIAKDPGRGWCYLNMKRLSRIL